MRRIVTFIIFSTLLASAMTRDAAGQSRKPPAADLQGAQRPANVPDKAATTSSRIRGRVIADGRPVAEASIVVFPVNIASNMESAVTSFLRPVTSDADGKFELTGLRPGAYTIAGSSPGYVSDQDSKAFYRPGDNVTLTLVKGGVITGRVTNSSGDPVVGAVVRAIKVREPDDKPARVRGGLLSQISGAMAEILGPFKTDDRGTYRIYGLAPGQYQVAAGGRGAQGFSLGSATAYDGDAPTYYPSSTLDTAAEVLVLARGEANNIDIRYRENRGYSISGSISVSAGPMPQGTSVLLTRASSGVVEASTAVLAMRNQNRFAFDALLEGEYLVTAMGGSGMPMAGSEGLNALVSQSRRVTVRGADVTGVELVLEPLASIAGRAVLEPLQDPKQKAECKDVRPAPLEGAVLSARDQHKQASVDPIRTSLAEFKNTTPNDKGEFVIAMLRAGVQRLEVQLPGEHLYVRSTLLTQADPTARSVDVAKSGIRVKSGDKLKGLVVTISEGAAGLQGKVVTGEESKPPATQLRMHLVPAEPEAADEVLRYAEAEVAADGTFSMTNLAPAKYWLVQREVSDQEPAEADRKPLAWDAGERAVLRFEGEASKKILELSRCQRLTDFVFSYTPLIKPSKPSQKKPTF